MNPLNLITARISPRLFLLTGLFAGMLAITGTSLASAPVLVSIDVTPTDPTVPVGLSLAFTAIGLFADGTHQDVTAVATWSSSDPSAATIDNAGVAFGVGLGSTQISAQLDSISGSTTLTVTNAAVVSIEVTPTNPSVPLNFPLAFTAIAHFSDGGVGDVTASAFWSSSNSSATINNAGVAVGLSPGSTQISAQFGGVSGSTTLTVENLVLVSIEVFPADPTVLAGLSLAFTAIGLLSDGETTVDATAAAIWSSSDPSLATISNAAGSQGVAIGVSPGSTQISAQFGNISGSTTLTVTSPYSAQVQQPINADGSSVFSVRRGVVPVKFTLTQDGVATCALPPATIALTRTAGGTTGAIDENVYSGSADTGSNFRIDSCQYVYNLNSGALGPGTYRVDININGQTVGSGIFGLH